MYIRYDIEIQILKEVFDRLFNPKRHEFVAECGNRK